MSQVEAPGEARAAQKAEADRSAMESAPAMKPAPKPTIVRVVARLNVGGPAIQTILMTEAFRARGYRTLLLAGEVPAGERSMEYLAEQKEIPVIRIDSMSRRIAPLRDLRALGRIWKVLRRERPGIVHTHTAKAGVLGRVAAMMGGVPIRVHTFHGHVFDGYFSAPVTRLFVAIERMLARHTDCIIAISERQRWDLVHRFRIAPAAKVVVVPLGFEVDAFLDNRDDGSSFRREAGCDVEAPLVAWIGRVSPIKNPGLFVEAAAALLPELPSARFVMLGDGERSRTVQQSVNSHGLAGAFRMLPSREDMPGVYAGIDLLVLTSRNEGTPVVLLEAMACGKPFIATDVGGVADLMTGRPMQRNGYRVFANGVLAEATPEAFAGAARYLLERRNLRLEMGEEGRKFVAKRYSRQRLADDLERLYRQLSLSKERKDAKSAASSTPAAGNEIA